MAIGYVLNVYYMWMIMLLTLISPANKNYQLPEHRKLQKLLVVIVIGGMVGNILIFKEAIQIFGKMLS